MEEKRLNESRFLWGTLAIILILPLLGLLNSGNTGGSTLSGATVIVPEQAIQTISTASAGSELFFEIKVGGVKDLTLKFREDVRDMKLVISSPVSTGWFEGKSYSTFEVSSESASAVESLKFTLKISEADLLNKGLIKEKVKLFDSSGILTTNLLKVENGYVYYSTQSKTFGAFVIGTAKESPKTAVAGKAETLPEPKVEEEPEIEAVEPVAVEVASEEVIVEEPGFFGKVGIFLRNFFS